MTREPSKGSEGGDEEPPAVPLVRPTPPRDEDQQSDEPERKPVEEPKRERPGSGMPSVAELIIRPTAQRQPVRFQTTIQVFAPVPVSFQSPQWIIRGGPDQSERNQGNRRQSPHIWSGIWVSVQTVAETRPCDVQGLPPMDLVGWFSKQEFRAKVDGLLETLEGANWRA
jgi:hypothetical protein